MINSTISGISKAISEAYPDCDIYREDVPQDLEPPCFHVEFVHAIKKQQLKKRATLKNHYDIKFFASEGDKHNHEINSVMLTLFEILAFIKLPNGDILRATEMSAESDDGVLHILCSYNISVKLTEEKAEEMQILNSEVGLKNGN